MHAHQYADFATMRGDSSDGLPGVAGVGDKTAATLLQRFGDIDAIIAAAQDPDGDMGPGPRGKIKAALDYLAVAPTGGRGRPRHRPRLPRPHPARASPPTRRCWPRISEKFGLGGSVDRLVETLAR